MSCAKQRCLGFIIRASFLSVFLLPPTVFALPFDFGAKGGLENFLWEEFDQNDTKLLEESGVRFTLGGWFGNTRKFERRLIYNVDAKAYFGTVDYDGQTQDGVKITTETDYDGFAVEGEIGVRVGDLNGNFGWDFVGGLGIDSWTRDLNSNIDVLGRPISGYVEEYTIINTRLGTGATWWGNKYHGRVIFGLKLPVWTNETTENIELEPKGTLSPYVKFSNYIQLTKTLQLLIDIYYDTYRFDKSDEVVVTDGTNIGTIHQPKSSQDVFGVQGGVAWLF